ncbi:hypothetical protein EZS27_015556 [termite gut metagenome]|uniref:Phage major capsid protein n=1 Tax=termite gut metagenome TaxID=433724 RepID=A0A5J4RRD2_9ZZZZ
MKIKLLLCLLFNAVMGATLALTLGVPTYAGAVAAVGVSAFAGNFMPPGAACEGVLVEVWTGELIKTLRAGLVATFLDGLPDYSQYAENDAIHMVNIGGDPDVLINNTTYPIAIQNITDADATFSLDKFQTKATPITDDELFALSYDKMASVKERHAEVITLQKFSKSIHALAPDSHTTKTPVLKTTGEIVGGTATGRRRLQLADIVALKDAFDKLEIPVQNRRLVLCSDHVNDLLLTEQKFAAQFYNYTSGKIANLYGFEVYEYSNNPVYRVAGSKLPFDTTAGANEFQASVAFYTKRVFKATGSTTMYYSEAKTDPLNQRSLINFRHYFIVLPKKKDAFGAIMSAYASA